jgi:hypothetical protein
LEWANIGLILHGINTLPRIKRSLSKQSQANNYFKTSMCLCQSKHTNSFKGWWSASNNYRHSKTWANGIMFGEVRSSWLHGLTKRLRATGLPSNVPLVLEIIVSDETQGLLLAAFKGQIKHEGSPQKKKHGTGHIHLWPVHSAETWDSHASLFRPHFCKGLLGLHCTTTEIRSSPVCNPL